MPVPTPFHQRTAPLCTSYRWKEWAGCYAVCAYDSSHEPEYFAFRNATGMLDVSPLKKYQIDGADSARFLAYVMSRDIAELAVGRVAYTCVCDDSGKLIDDGTVARRDDNSYRVTSASPLLWWLMRHARGFRVEVTDTSDDTAALALQGPTSRDVLAAACQSELDGVPFFGLTTTDIGGIPVEITRTGFTGDLGYEVWVAAEHALPLWDTLMAAGAPHGVLPAGLDALDMTRIEAGFVLQDVDYFSAPRCLLDSRKSSPYEAGLGWTVQLDREPFIGRAALATEKTAGSPWATVGLEIQWPEIEQLYERHGLPPRLPECAWRTALPLYDGGRQVGQATSGTWSPLCKRNLALATVEARYAEIGTLVQIEHTVEFERRTVTAEVTPRPFFDPVRKRA